MTALDILILSCGLLLYSALLAAGIVTLVFWVLPAIGRRLLNEYDHIFDKWN